MVSNENIEEKKRSFGKGIWIFFENLIGDILESWIVENSFRDDILEKFPINSETADYISNILSDINYWKYDFYSGVCSTEKRLL